MWYVLRQKAVEVGPEVAASAYWIPGRIKISGVVLRVAADELRAEQLGAGNRAEDECEHHRQNAPTRPERLFHGIAPLSIALPRSRHRDWQSPLMHGMVTPSASKGLFDRRGGGELRSRGSRVAVLQLSEELRGRRS